MVRPGDVDYAIVVVSSRRSLAKSTWDVVTDCRRHIEVVGDMAMVVKGGCAVLQFWRVVVILITLLLTGSRDALWTRHRPSGGAEGVSESGEEY